MRTYSKPALTIEQQIALLESRRGCQSLTMRVRYGISQTLVTIG